MTALIARFGQDDAVPRLIELAQRGPLALRAAAYSALPLVPSEASLGAALAGLKDADPVIRSAAAGALGAMRKPRGVEALLAALSGEKSPVAEAILIALGNSKSPRALPVLAAALDQARRSGSRPRSPRWWHSAARRRLTCSSSAFDTRRHGAAISDRPVALAEKLGQPLNTDWIRPVLMCRMEHLPGWLDSLRLVRMYAGEKAIPTLLGLPRFRRRMERAELVDS